MCTYDGHEIRAVNTDGDVAGPLVAVEHLEAERGAGVGAVAATERVERNLQLVKGGVRALLDHVRAGHFDKLTAPEMIITP